MGSVYERIGKIKVIPVVAIDSAESALPLADALLEGGLPVAEITFRTDAAIQQCVAYGLVVGDVLPGNRRLRTHGVFTRVMDRDLRREVLCLENDGRSEVSERATRRHLPSRLHGLRCFPKQRFVALAADEAESLVTPGLLINDRREFPFNGSQFVPSRYPLLRPTWVNTSG